jgi:hypothetical protein
MDLVLNPYFRKHNLEIFNQLAEKIIKNTAWIERPPLVQYTLALATILALSRCNFDSQSILALLLKHQALTNETIT